jgi:hypothetical protein
MTLPYENSTAGDRALADLQKILRGFGCSRFGSMVDDGAQEILVQFEYRGRPVSIKASVRGYAAAWLKAHPYNHRMRCTRLQHEKRALEVAGVAVYSILRDWVKGQVTAIECGILTFEGAFLGQLVLPDGRTVLERVAPELPRLAGPEKEAA